MGRMIRFLTILFVLSVSCFAQVKQWHLTNTTSNVQLQLDTIYATVYTNGFVDAQISKPTSGSVYTFGDSQTYGANVTVTNYTSGSRLLPEFRWTDKLATWAGVSLTNAGVSGSGFFYSTGSSAAKATPLNLMGSSLPASWSGVVSVMIGYNSSGAISSASWDPFLMPIYMAQLSRPLLDGWIATEDGLSNTGSEWATWSTDATENTETEPAYNPFPVGSPGTDNRVSLVLSGSKFATLTLTNAVSAGVYFEADNQGGVVNVYVNGYPRGSINMASQGSASVYMPGCVWIEGLTGNSTIGITNASGTNRLLAVGYVNAVSTTRRVVGMSPVNFDDDSTGRTSGMLRQLGYAMAGAAYELRRHPVFVADTFSAVSPTGDRDSATDLFHPNPSGAHKIYEAVIRAQRMTSQGSFGADWVNAAAPPNPKFKGSVGSIGRGTTGNNSATFDLDAGALGFGSMRWMTNGSRTYAFVNDGANGTFALNRYIANAAQTPVWLLSGDGTSTMYYGLTNRSGVLEVGYPGVGSALVRTYGIAPFFDAQPDSGASGGFRIRSDAGDRLWALQGDSSGVALNRYVSNVAQSPVWVSDSSGNMSISGSTTNLGWLRVGRDSTANSLIEVNAPAASLREVRFLSAGSSRWRVGANSTAESGSNAGSDFQIVAGNDAGSTLSIPFLITRSTGQLNLGSGSTALTRIKHGTATLSAGSAVVSDASVTANSRVLLTSQVDGGTPGWLRVSARTSSTSFTITSSSATDTSTVAWVIIEP
jgi:hypothetical protein